MGVNDDPRAILAAAGVECPELNLYLRMARDEALGDDEDEMEPPFASDVFLALAQLVAQLAGELERRPIMVPPDYSHIGGGGGGSGPCLGGFGAGTNPPPVGYCGEGGGRGWAKAHWTEDEEAHPNPQPTPETSADDHA